MLALGKRHQLQPRDHRQQLPRLGADLLPVAQPAGVVVRRLDRQRMRRLGRAKLHQKLVNVLRLPRKHLGLRLLRAACEQMPVFLQHRAAAAGVVDDRIDALQLLAERAQVLPRHLQRRLHQPRVVVQRTTTTLPRRHQHLAAVLL